MPSIQAITTALFACIAVSNASLMTMSEGGTPGGCTGGTGCCIPTCNVDVTDSLGVSGVVRWTGNCQARASAPSGTQDFADDNYQMTWFTDENGQSVIDVFRKSDKIYDRWAVTNCKVPDSTGGSQCAPSGGSCDLTQTLFSAQG